MRRNLACATTLITLVSFLASPLPASGNSAIVIDGTTGQLWDLDLSTGQYSNPRGTGLVNAGALRFDSQNNLYALTDQAIYRVNPLTGASTPIPQLWFANFNGVALAWDAATNTMFGSEVLIPDSTVARHHLKINIGIGTEGSHIIGDWFVSQHVADSTFDDQDRLWLLHLGLEQYGYVDSLIEVNETLGNPLSSVRLSQNLCCTAGMDFDPVTQTMYVVNGRFGHPADLYSIDRTNGVLTLIGSDTGPQEPTGMAILLPSRGDLNGDGKVDAADYVAWRKSNGSASSFNVWRANFGTTYAVGTGSSLSNEVPEPSTLLLLVIGAISLLGSRKP